MSRNSALEPALDQKLIVRAALDLLDEVGLDALSMRRLAEKLNIKAASLYWHVRDKEHLLSLLADEICAAMLVPDSTLPWREQIEALGHENRRALRSHRDAARVLAQTLPLGPNRLRLMEVALTVLLKAGFSPRDAAYAGFLLNDYVTMFVVEETRFSAEDQAAKIEQIYTDWFASLSPEEFPTLRSLAGHLLADNADERFSFGMEVLLDGLEMKRKNRPE
ncbi:MAG: TetR family transcriptional regulator [Chloroflexi bacterium]|nr:TetR family transcriptional regulator [Chloroflexota bacterium]